MGGIPPKCIITDQCESIKRAIAKMMPSTGQRYCLWHITQKLPDKFRHNHQFHDAGKAFKRVIYGCITTEMFEEQRAEFVQTYELQNQVWFQSMCREKTYWVPCYLNQHFWGDMVSTKRSEGMHAFFDGYISRCSTLKTFVEQYEIAFSAKFQKERDANFQSKNTMLKLVSHYPWERQFRSVYTNQMFAKFQQEIRRLLYCNVVTQVSDPARGVETISVTDKSGDRELFPRNFAYTVEYKGEGEYFSCNCRMFESMGHYVATY